MRLRVITNGRGAGGQRPPGQDDGVWVEEKLSGGWVACGRMAMQGSRAVVAELRIVPLGELPPAGGITYAVARAVPLGSLGPYVLAAASFAQHSGIGGLRKHFTASVGALLPRLTRLLPPRPRPRRASGRDDLFYAKVARAYLAAGARGSRRPVAELAAARGESASRVRDMVHEARERGLLSPSTPGVRGGRLLPRGLALLSRRGTTEPRLPKPRRPRR